MHSNHFHTSCKFCQSMDEVLLRCDALKQYFHKVLLTKLYKQVLTCAFVDESVV